MLLSAGIAVMIAMIVLSMKIVLLFLSDEPERTGVGALFGGCH